MIDHRDPLLYKLRFVFAGVFVLISLLLLSLLVQAIQTSNGTTATQDKTSSSTADSGSLNTYDGPNAVTNVMGATANNSGRIITGTGHAVNASFVGVGKQITKSSVQTGKFVTHAANTTGAFAAHSTLKGIGFAARGIGSSIAFVAHVPANTFGAVSNTAVVSAVIEPANSASSSVPIIDPKSPALLATHPITPLKNVSKINAAPIPATESEPSWPIHGEITTLFGVPHWPYQPTHTGLDISDGQHSGVTPVKSFKPGRVINTVHSYVGLGNHIVVDHGGGVTSVYGHLYSISVQTGQQVDQQTTLGLEGSTGASTGTHLHFEIRINGQPVNPLLYVTGRP